MSQVVFCDLRHRNPGTHHVACSEQRRERRKALGADVVGRPRVVDHLVGREVVGEEGPLGRRNDLGPRQANRLGRPCRAGREQDRADLPGGRQLEVVGRLGLCQQLGGAPGSPRELGCALRIEHDHLLEVLEPVGHVQQPGHKVSEARHRARVREVQRVHKQVATVVHVDGGLGGAQPAKAVPPEQGFDGVVLHRDDDFVPPDADAAVHCRPAPRLGGRLGVAERPSLDVADVDAPRFVLGPPEELAQRGFRCARAYLFSSCVLSRLSGRQSLRCP